MENIGETFAVLQEYRVNPNETEDTEWTIIYLSLFYSFLYDMLKKTTLHEGLRCLTWFAFKLLIKI